MEEDSRRCDRATKWVKVTQLPPMGEEEVKEDLENLSGQPIKSCKEHAPGFLVEAYTEEGVKALLLPNQIEVLPGRRIRVARHEDAMTATAIFDFITNKLHHRLRWTTQMANSSARPPTPTNFPQRGNTPPRRGDWGEWPQEEPTYWQQPSYNQQQRSKSQPPSRYAQNQPSQKSQGQWRQNRPQYSNAWRGDRGNQWRQERRLSFSSQEDPGTPRGDSKAQWPREPFKGGNQTQAPQSSSSGRGPPAPQVVQAIQDQRQANPAPNKGKGDPQPKLDSGKGKGKGKGGGSGGAPPPSGGSNSGSVKGDGKGKGKGGPLECAVCKALHRESMNQGTGPIPYQHYFRTCELSNKL